LVEDALKIASKMHALVRPSGMLFTSTAVAFTIKHIVVLPQNRLVK